MFATASSLPNRFSPEQRDKALNFDDVLRILDKAPQTMVERSRFTLDGMVYEVRRVPFEGGTRFLISVTLGYLPFSIESAERRETIKTIVRASGGLPKVRFTITAASRIMAGGVFEVNAPVSPNYVFYPLTLFLQEARPFMRLLGEHLYAIAPAAEAESA